MQIRGQERAKLVEERARTRVGTSLFAGMKASEADPAAASLGNLYRVPTSDTVRQMTKEIRKQSQLHDDPRIELIYVAENQAKKPELLVGIDNIDRQLGVGFYKSLRILPFGFSMYYNQQLAYGVGMFSTGKCSLHIDASGNFVGPIPGSKRNLTYSLVPVVEGSPVAMKFPMAEWSSSSHTVPAIKGHMEELLWRKNKLSKKAHPEMIVTDWSWALIHASIESFNHVTTLVYNEKAYELIKGQYNGKQVMYCNAHVP